MEYLELKVPDESPTVIMNDKDEVIGNISVQGDGEVAKTRVKHIGGAINGYTNSNFPLLQVFPLCNTLRMNYFIH